MAIREVKGRLTGERLEHELQWRSWFPEGVELDSRDHIPDGECDRLVQAFEKFCLEAIKIKVPGARVPFALRDAQRSTVRSWIQDRYTITLKARQIGFSTLAAAFALWTVFGGPDRQVYMLSKGEREAIKLLNKAKFAYKLMPQWVKDRAPAEIDQTKLRLSFDNDSFLESAPTGSNPIRGETAFLVIVDEWAQFDNEEEAWASIEPVTDIGGRCVGLSTAKGEGSFFHRLWVGAETESNDFAPIFHPWWAVPERDQDWYDRKCRNMEPWQRAQEYPSNPEEAFIGSGNPFFDLEILRDMVPREPVGEYTITLGAGSTGRYDLAEGGDYTVWELPAHGRSYVVGADVAQGLDHGDWSVAYVMDSESGDIVAMYRGKVAPDYFGDMLCAIGYHYNYALIAPEVNNHGISTVKEIQRNRYGRLYRRRTTAKRQQTPLETVGWLTTHGNKTDMANGVSAWIRDHNIPHRGTINELKTFRREQRGERVRLQGSPHDDCVMALAITIQARQYAVKNNVEGARPASVPGSIEWWAEKLDRGTRQKRRRMHPVF